MHAIVLHGSPRPEGNTARILDWVEKDLEELGHTAERIDITELDIKGCKSCYACAENTEEPGCAIADDAGGVFDKMIRADAIVFATPLYMWGVSAQIKALFDRSLCLSRGYLSPEHTSFVEGKPTVLVLTCGGPEQGNAEPVTTTFPRYAGFLKLDNRGVYVFPHCAEPKHLPNTHGTRAREIAERLFEG